MKSASVILLLCHRRRHHHHHRIFLSFLLSELIALLFSPSTFVHSADDMECLQAFYSSVQDPVGCLFNWNFKSDLEGSVCSFSGVECWESPENRVLSLKLKGCSLSGSFPQGLNLCSSLQEIDLSHNNLSGGIPSDICVKGLPYITSMDLSHNEFSGNLPGGFYHCVFLRSLKLQDNYFSGELPWQIGLLPRLIALDLSDNELTGSIPSSFTNRTAIQMDPFPASSFANNPGLCGAPLDNIPCTSLPTPNSFTLPTPNSFIGHALIVAVVLALVSMLLVWCCFCRNSPCFRR